MAYSKKFPLSIIAVLLMSSACSASVFSDLFSYANTLTTVQTSSISEQQDDFYAQLQSLNTQTAIDNIDAEMGDYNVNTVKVRVNNLPWENNDDISEQFYIVKGMGITDHATNSDAEITLSYSQIQKIIPFLTDGKLSFLERFQIYAIYKVGEI